MKVIKLILVSIVLCALVPIHAIAANCTVDWTFAWSEGKPLHQYTRNFSYGNMTYEKNHLRRVKNIGVHDIRLTVWSVVAC